MKKNNPRNYWTFEKCREEALKYTNKKDFKDNAGGAFSIATKRNKWQGELYVNLIRKVKPNGYWENKEICKEEALKYEKRSHMKRNSGRTYIVSKNSDWLDEFFPLNNNN